MLEKPIGKDLASAIAINDAVAKAFDEERIFRTDHYLGKEGVQNLIALRFGNSLFEPLWSARHIEQVQITVGETVGVEGRGDYYERIGRRARHAAKPSAATTLPGGDGALHALTPRRCATKRSRCCAHCARLMAATWPPNR